MLDAAIHQYQLTDFTFTDNISQQKHS